MSSGEFISFEGGEGSGKTTQIKLLSDSLIEAGIKTRLTREPGGSPGAEEIRQLLVEGSVTRWDAETETLLHCAARRDHITKVILPSLESGEWVLSDRFMDSTLAYQGFAQGVKRDDILRIYRFVAGSLMPDMTIIMDLPIEKGLSRANKRPKVRKKNSDSEDRYERMGSIFHNRLRNGFLRIAESNKDRCVIIDASQSMEKVRTEIWYLVCERFEISGKK